MLLVQPQLSHRKEWEELALREGLFFELAETFMPPLLGDTKLRRDALEAWRGDRLVRSLHGAFIDVNPASGDIDIRELSQRRCRESCEYARKLGASWLVLHSAAFPFLRGAYLENWAAVCADFYTELAENFDLNICIENSMDLDSAPLEALFARISDRRLSVCLDVGHAAYSRQPLEKWFDALGDRIGYMHLSDNMGAFDEHLPLGAGSIDWTLADRAWRAMGREMPITLEMGSLEDALISLRFLKERGLFSLREGR